MADPNQRESSTYTRPKRFGKIEIIKKDESGTPVVYLRRWYLWRCKWFSIRIHHIMLADLDRDPHDHPWPFISIILRGGGYTEDWTEAEHYRSVRGAWSQLSRLHRRVRWASFHRSTDLHAIKEFANGKDVWTLFLTGREGRVWGFRTPEGWVPWDKYEAAGEIGPDPGDS